MFSIFWLYLMLQIANRMHNMLSLLVTDFYVKFLNKNPCL